MSEDLFREENIPKSNWMSFDNVGDYIKGTLVDTFYKKGTGQMPDQWVYVLKNVTINNDALGFAGEKAEDIQEEYNVGIRADKDFIHSRMKKAKLGQVVGLKFEKEIPPKQKGYNPAKSITPYVGEMDEKADELIKKDDGIDFGEEKEINSSDIPY